jgi:hypothetical protein
VPVYGQFSFCFKFQRLGFLGQVVGNSRVFALGDVAGVLPGGQEAITWPSTAQVLPACPFSVPARARACVCMRACARVP